MPTEQQTETQRQGIAREIAKRYTQEGTGYADRLYQLAYAIEAALKKRDERAARIAEIIPDTEFDLDHEPARSEQQIRNGIAAAIRNEAHK